MTLLKIYMSGKIDGEISEVNWEREIGRDRRERQRDEKNKERDRENRRIKRELEILDEAYSICK